MKLIMTDEELKVERDRLMEIRKTLNVKRKALVRLRREHENLRRSIKDYTVKREISDMIFEISRNIRYVDAEIGANDTLIHKVDELLYPTPSVHYGNIYDCGSCDLDFEDIEIFGIGGVKL